MKETGIVQRNINTFEEADQALLELGRIEASLQEAEAALNEQIQSLRDKYEQKTRDIASEKESIENALESFGIHNKNEFEDVRTRELIHGSIGFKMSPPKVGLLNRKYKWETVLELLRRVRWGSAFIRSKEEPDKEAILTAVADKSIDDTKLASVGLKIDQEDKFQYNIKWDTIQ